MSDNYGYAERRMALAARMGVAYSYMEKEWPDERLYDARLKQEGEGFPVHSALFGSSCDRCSGGTHLSDEELSVSAAALNRTHFVWASHPDEEVQIVIRAGVTTADANESLDLLSKLGEVNRDRCVSVDVKSSVLA